MPEITSKKQMLKHQYRVQETFGCMCEEPFWLKCWSAEFQCKKKKKNSCVCLFKVECHLQIPGSFYQKQWW